MTFEAGYQRSDSRIHMPFVGHTFERVFPAILKYDAGPGHQVFDGSRHEYLIGPCQTGDPRADVYGDAGNIGTDSLDFTCVDSGCYL